MYVGIFGDVIFSVGHLRTLTLSNFKGTSGAKWVDHEVIGGKAKSEYIAPKLMEYTCDILLDADHGVNPRKMLNRLKQMTETEKSIISSSVLPHCQKTGSPLPA